MRVPERLGHILRLLPERVVEGYIRHGSGRAQFVAELLGRIRAGGEVFPEDENHISLMPPSWRETARICIRSAYLLGEADRLILKNT